MSGSTDAPFRRQATRFGAPAVVSEMVAGETLVSARPDTVRRTCRHEGAGAWIVQLAARRPEDMAAGARLLRESGVDVIDINMGCPARKVTGGRSGSALMREPDLAEAIVHAALEGAGEVPVTLKMRLGWDQDMLNAPEIARMAEAAGVRMLTVHARTRCMFYKGEADWTQIRDTVEAVSIPVIANGDIVDVATARVALARSGAHGIMIGRAALGQPWLVGQVAGELTGRTQPAPSLAEQCDSLCDQVSDAATLYGETLGVRTVRKHVAAAIDRLDLGASACRAREARRRLCQESGADRLISGLRALYAGAALRVAA